MNHLDVRGSSACRIGLPLKADGGVFTTTVSYEQIDEVDCEECLASLYGKAAERLDASLSHAKASRDLKRLLAAGKPRILGPLGSQDIDPELKLPDRLRQRMSTMSDDEKFESFIRLVEMAVDICPGCYGSIATPDHTSDCLGPDPEEWVLSQEEVTAELEVQGVDVNAAMSSLHTLMNKHAMGGFAALDGEMTKDNNPDLEKIKP